MADVTGPVRSMPGSRHVCPENSTCDDCGAPATVRMQGETDSFGSEMADLCQACYDKIQESCVDLENTPSYCEWCHTVAEGCKPFRDADEGSTGPIYTVCKTCRAADSEKWAAEADAMADTWSSGCRDDDDY